MNLPLSRRIMLSLGAPVAAALFAGIISALVLEITGSSSLKTFETMFEFGTRLETVVQALNRATPLYLSGVAAAIGFRMNLFNIGVEGQYLVASFAAAAIGAELALPGFFHVAIIMIVAMVVGSLAAGIAGLLKVTRGVNEVISTIMLNAILVAGVIAAIFPHVIDRGSNAANAGTKIIPESGWLPGLNGAVEIFTRDIKGSRSLTGMFLAAIIVGVIYHFVVNRTRFGYDLRASGMNPFAARASGVPPKKMIMIAMLASGLVAGLIGMPEILSNNHSYDQGFVQGLGFAGIAVALLGRNNASGMAAAALLFGFLDSSAAILQVRQLASSSITAIMQATVLIAAVVAYQVAERIRQREEIRAASAALESTPEAVVDPLPEDRQASDD